MNVRSCVLALMVVCAACTPADIEQIGQSPRLPDDASNPCPVTLPSEQPFIPPAPFPADPPGGLFWYGDASLWTALPADGIWSDLPETPNGYGQKTLWWRADYVWTTEPEPALEITGHRLDDPAITLFAETPTNAYAPDIQSAMLVGIGMPTPGCWQISGRYAETELSVIVLVEPM